MNDASKLTTPDPMTETKLEAQHEWRIGRFQTEDERECAKCGCDSADDDADGPCQADQPTAGCTVCGGIRQHHAGCILTGYPVPDQPTLLAPAEGAIARLERQCAASEWANRLVVMVETADLRAALTPSRLPTTEPSEEEVERRAAVAGRLRMAWDHGKSYGLKTVAVSAADLPHAIAALSALNKGGSHVHR